MSLPQPRVPRAAPSSRTEGPLPAPRGRMVVQLLSGFPFSVGRPWGGCSFSICKNNPHPHLHPSSVCINTHSNACLPTVRGHPGWQTHPLSQPHTTPRLVPTQALVLARVLAGVLWVGVVWGGTRAFSEMSEPDLREFVGCFCREVSAFSLSDGNQFRA